LLPETKIVSQLKAFSATKKEKIVKILTETATTVAETATN